MRLDEKCMPSKRKRRRQQQQQQKCHHHHPAQTTAWQYLKLICDVPLRQVSRRKLRFFVGNGMVVGRRMRMVVGVCTRGGSETRQVRVWNNGGGRNGPRKRHLRRRNGISSSNNSQTLHCQRQAILGGTLTSKCQYDYRRC